MTQSHTRRLVAELRRQLGEDDPLPAAPPPMRVDPPPPRIFPRSPKTFPQFAKRAAEHIKKELNFAKDENRPDSPLGALKFRFQE